MAQRVWTFLFTDIEGSSRKWEADGPAMSRSLARHDALLRDAIEVGGGRVFKTVGDAFCAAFSSPRDAIVAAGSAQRALGEQAWEAAGGLLVRMALHTGEAEERDGDYFGPALNRVARILSLVSGGQVVLSLATAELLGDSLPPGWSLRLLGRFALKDLSRPENLYQALVPGLRSDFPALRSLDGSPHNLPLQPTPYFDRELETAEIMLEFRRRGARLVTLTGAGGVGKTRLAAQAAGELVEDFEGGAWFVDLSASFDLPSMIGAVNRALSARERPGLSPREALAERLAGKDLLLVLDNLEQNAEAPALIDELLSSAAGLKILATSREALRIRWERVRSVGSLPVPPREGAATDRLAQYAAVSLFIDRAKAARPSFAVTDGNAPAIAEICSRLDGVPLAIELAAARSRSFGPEEILARLEPSLGFVAGGPDLPERHRTLRAVALWSYGLLGDEERAAWRSLACFAGAFDLELAEELIAETLGKGASAADALVSSLVDRSLLVADADEAGGTSYRMLASLRAFALERSRDEGPRGTEAARDRLMLERAARGRGEGAGRLSIAAWNARIEGSYADYAAAHDRFVAAGDGSAALRMSAGLWRWWYRSAQYSEGIARIENTLLCCGADSPDARPARAESLVGLAALRRSKGQAEASIEALDLARAIYLADADGAGLAAVEAERGWCMIMNGRLADARPHLVAALADGATPRARTAACEGIAVLANSAGDLGGARAWHRRAIDEARSGGEETAAARALSNLALLEDVDGNHEMARDLYAEAMQAFEATGDREGCAQAAVNLGWSAAATEDYDEALRLFTQAAPRVAKIGSERLAANLQAGRASVLEALGRADQAIAAAEAGIERAERSDDVWDLLRCTYYAARARARRGDFIRARRDAAMAVAKAAALGDKVESERARAARDFVERLAAEAAGRREG